MKRLIALLLSISMILPLLAGVTGCSSRNLADNLTFGQWLVMVNDVFGMQSYTSDEPYFTSVQKDNAYFAAVQTATEWEVINRDEDIDVDAPLRWDKALITLINVGNFMDSDASDSEKIDCAIKLFDKSIRKYWMNREISLDKAATLLYKAQELWANRRVEERIEEVKYNEGIHDFSPAENEVLSDPQSNMLVVSENAGDIQVGDICIIPDEENSHEKKFVRVGSVREENGSRVIIPSDDEVKLEDVYERLHLEETIEPTAENTVIYDGYGNVVPINEGAVHQNAVSNSESPRVINLSTQGKESGDIINCAKVTHSVTFDGCTVKLGVSREAGGKLGLSAAIECPNMLGTAAEENGRTLKFTAGVSISDVEVTHKFDWGVERKGIVFVPTLKTAQLKVDYKTQQTIGLKYSGKEEFLAAPAYSNGNGKFLTNFARAVMKRKDGNVYGAETIASKKEIKICSLNVYSAGVATVCLDVIAAISVEGTVEISVTESGSKGIEYKNGNLRHIKISNRSEDVQAKAKVEATLAFGPALYVKGLKKRLVGVEVKAGVGAMASLKAHLADSQMHLIEEMGLNDITPEQASAMASVSNDITATASAIQAVAQAQGGVYRAEQGETVKLHVDWCIDVKAYGLLSFGIMDQSYLTELLNAKKVSLSVSLLDEKNATFLNMHVDNFNWTNAVYNWGKYANGDNCTLKYVPFDEATDNEITDDQVTESKNNIVIGENLLLSSMNVNMEVGQYVLVEVTTLPKGYTAEDVVFSSKDESVAKVSDKGIVTAVGEGCTIVYASTKDKKFTAAVAVIISPKKEPASGGGVRT